MKLHPLLNSIREKQPVLVTPFVEDYFMWADKYAATKPYFYGRWSLKWALCVILPKLKPIQVKNLVHHIVTELATIENPDEVAQFVAIKLVALHPWKQMLNEQKNTIDVRALNYIHAGGFKIVLNDTPNNLTSMIFRKTNADAVIQVNPETLSAAISLRGNSKINLLEGLKHYLTTELSKEPGWKIANWPPATFINYGIQSKTPTAFNIITLPALIINYFNK